jgi:hypothetical protein
MDLIKGIIAFFMGVFIMFAAFAGIVLVMALLWAIPTVLLWNWLMPDLFGLAYITIWQAIGINLLASILFKSNRKDKDKDGDKNKKEFKIG